MLHGSSSDWEALRKTFTYYEEQLRLCEAPGSSAFLGSCSPIGKDSLASKLHCVGLQHVGERERLLAA